MYAVYINNDNTISTLVNQQIYQGYKCTDWFWIFMLPYYNGTKMTGSIAKIEFVLPVSGKKITEKISLKSESYNGYSKYSIYSKSKITNEPGIVHARIYFEDSTGNIIREISSFSFKVSTTREWHNDSSNGDYNNNNPDNVGGCNCGSEEHINEILTKTKPPAFDSINDAESKLNSGDISNVYYGQTIIINDGKKYVPYIVQKGNGGYVIEPVDHDGGSMVWEEDD